MDCECRTVVGMGRWGGHSWNGKLKSVRGVCGCKIQDTRLKIRYSIFKIQDLFYINTTHLNTKSKTQDARTVNRYLEPGYQIFSFHRLEPKKRACWSRGKAQDSKLNLYQHHTPQHKIQDAKPNPPKH